MQDLKENALRFNQEAIIISNLQYKVAYTAFPIGLASGSFKLSLTEIN